tara:strand:+ start:11564 stop:11914 length:351 start_codon:yes stop_codon:yes gene_type:complete
MNDYVDPPIPENINCSMSFYVDDEDNIWVSAEWTETEEGLDKFAEFMFKLNSGLMLSDSLGFLKEECYSQGKIDTYKRFMLKLNDLYDDVIQEGHKDAKAKERPVVRPTKVKNLGY